MKLFLKRDTSSPFAAFSVFDELGNVKYTVDFQKTAPIVRLAVKGKNNVKLLTIRRFTTPDLCVYILKQKGKSNVNLVVKRSKDGVFCLFYGINRHIVGNVLYKNFKIIDVDNTVLATHKRSFSNGGESYELEIFDSSNELLYLASAVCLDLINVVDNFKAQTV